MMAAQQLLAMAAAMGAMSPQPTPTNSANAAKPIATEAFMRDAKARQPRKPRQRSRLTKRERKARDAWARMREDRSHADT